MLATAMSSFYLASIIDTRNTDYITTVEEEDSSLLYFYRLFLLSAHVLNLMHLSRFSFKNMRAFSASRFSYFYIFFARLGLKFSLLCN